MVPTRGVGTIDVVMTGSEAQVAGHLAQTLRRGGQAVTLVEVSGGFRTRPAPSRPTMVGAGP